MNKLILIAALAAAAHATSAPAFAPAAEKQVATIDAAGLNLANARGLRALDRRIFHAAAELCGTPSAFDLRARSAVEACIADAVTRAEAARSRAIALSQSGRPVLASGQ